ncbi:hypothetical protein [Streptomyces sp. NPDC001020]
MQFYRVEIKSPAPVHVFRRHLRVYGVPYEQYMQADSVPTAEEFLGEQRPMREIATFADLVRRAREAARPGTGFADWCATAHRAWDDRRREIAKLVAERPEGPQRALLITVAMLHGAHADVIHEAAQLLLRTAIRAHFWDHMPDLRRHLGTWTARSVDLTGPHITQELRHDLVARLAEEYLRTRNEEGLASLAEHWSTTTSSRGQLEAAVHALTCGLNDPEHGRSFRRRIYHWCVTKRLKGEFAQVLVQVCGDVIASSHPDQAMFRLYHLARRERGSTRALDALCELVSTSSRLRRRLLDRLARSALSPSELSIFLSACGPVPLIASYDNSLALIEERGVQDSLIRCWQAVLDGVPRTQWQPYAERWVHVATGNGRRGDLLLDLIVGAADRCEGKRGATFAALYASARAAERTSLARSVLRG